MPRRARQPDPHSGPHPSWVQIAGVIFAAATLLFLMALVVTAVMGHETPASSGTRFLLISVLAFGVALSAGFLGGNALAEGHLPIPFLKEKPLAFSVAGGVAVFVIVFFAGNAAFPPPEPAEPQVEREEPPYIEAPLPDSSVRPPVPLPLAFGDVNVRVVRCFYQSPHDPATIATAVRAMGIGHVDVDERSLPADWSDALRDTLLAGGPDVLILHYSCFQDTDQAALEAPERAADMRSLLRGLAGDDIRFVLYSRAFTSPSSMNDLLRGLGDVYAGEPGQRLFPLAVHHTEPFGTPETDARLQCTLRASLGGSPCEGSLPSDVEARADALRLPRG